MDDFSHHDSFKLTETVVGGAGCCLDLLHVLGPLAGALLVELHRALLFTPDVDVGEPAEGADVGLAVEVQLRHVVNPVNRTGLGLETLLAKYDIISP